MIKFTGVQKYTVAQLEQRAELLLKQRCGWPPEIPVDVELLVDREPGMLLDILPGLRDRSPWPMGAALGISRRHETVTPRSNPPGRSCVHQHGARASIARNTASCGGEVSARGRLRFGRRAARSAAGSGARTPRVTARATIKVRLAQPYGVRLYLIRS